jgi:MoaA/NifB/PqqE/SkfB family radical SAM enzyme
MKKVKEFARTLGVTSVSITGKGEPLLDFETVKEVITFFSEFPIELQTNGIVIKNDQQLLVNLQDVGLNIIAFSIDTLQGLYDLKEAINFALTLGLVVRITVNVTDLLREEDLDTIISFVKENNIHQINFRNIISPTKCEENSTHQWIQQHAQAKIYGKKKDETLYESYIHQLFKNYIKNSFSIRKLPYGARIYDVEGISITHFDYCIQERNNDDDIRSIIFMEDGHLYTSWGSKASLLF